MKRILGLIALAAALAFGGAAIAQDKKADAAPAPAAAAPADAKAAPRRTAAAAAAARRSCRRRRCRRGRGRRSRAAPRHRRPSPNKGDIAWMLTSTALVLMMSVPGAGAVLRRHGALEEHAVDADAGVRGRSR